MIRVISLGAGVQSTTMALMAALGEIKPMPDFAIFADTGWEPKAVYQQVDWLKGILPFPIITVNNGNIRFDLLARRNSTGHRFAAIPYFTLDEKTGHRGMGRRQCTHEYKIRPINTFVRSILRKREQAEMWIGISIDEATRIKPSTVKYIINRWPLIDLGISRASCIAWLKRKGFPLPPKSSCIGCPFHSDELWREMRDKWPDEWNDATFVDNSMRSEARGKLRAKEFMHNQRVPLEQVDLTTLEDHGQINMFENECEGICGV